MVFMREQFMALDKMTLAEIEALFAEDRVASFGLPIPGEAHDAVPGAIFFEV
jgi:hypothetical protein